MTSESVSPYGGDDDVTKHNDNESHDNTHDNIRDNDTHSDIPNDTHDDNHAQHNSHTHAVDNAVDNAVDHDTDGADDGAIPVDELIAANALDDANATDMGNGMRFKDMYRGVVRYVLDRQEWIIWDGKRWEPDVGELKTLGLTAGVIRRIRGEAMDLSDEPTEAGGVSPRERMLRWAIQSEHYGARRRMIESALEWPELIVTQDDLDPDPESLVCTNGTVDLRTGELRKSRSRDMNTHCTKIPYDPNVRTSPLFEQFCETFIPDEPSLDVVFMILGACIRGFNVPRILPFFVGTTTSGKSQLMDAVYRLLGSYACSITASVFRGNLDDKPRPDLVRAMFTRLAYAVEAANTWELHADQAKRLTGGGDPIPYRQLRQASVEHVPRFTPLIVTNEMPRIKGADTALKRRMVVVRFDKTLPSHLEDASVKSRFVRDPQTLQAILTRMVEGARSPAMKDGIKWEMIPKEFAAYTMESFDAVDHVSVFLEWAHECGRVKESPDAPASSCIRASTLHAWYVQWVKQHGNDDDRRQQLSMMAFGRALRERGWESARSDGIRWLGRIVTQPNFSEYGYS